MVSTNHNSVNIAKHLSASANDEVKVVSFLLNGRLETITAPPPNLMLIDYLRSPAVGLTGPKKPCAQGGCGSCAVIVSSLRTDASGKTSSQHRAINACLRPVAAINGEAITTIEATGSDAHGLNIVAQRIAENNGTQCGYCTNGWVMTMTELLVNYPAMHSNGTVSTSKTKKEIESWFDGNLCRCTGYRSLLEGLKTFASDWDTNDESNRMKCEIDAAYKYKPGTVLPSMPEAYGVTKPSLIYREGTQYWLVATTIGEMFASYLLGRIIGKTMFVHGHTSWGIYKKEIQQTQCFVDIRQVPELRVLSTEPVLNKPGFCELTFGAGVTYTDAIVFIENLLSQKSISNPSALEALLYMFHRTAGALVRNAASLGGNFMLMLNHLDEGEPFPSDAATAWAALPASVHYLDIKTKGAVVKTSIASLINNAVTKGFSNIIIVKFTLDFSDSRLQSDNTYMPQKVALRQVNSHSIVNCVTRYQVMSGKSPAAKTMSGCSIVMGGVLPWPVSFVQTCAYLNGKDPFDEATWKHAINVCAPQDIAAWTDQKKWSKRLYLLPDDGITMEYRMGLIAAFLYKSFINLLEAHSQKVSPNIVSSGKEHWNTLDASSGKQVFDISYYREPLSKPYIKLMAFHQAQGEVKYTHEQPAKPDACHAALVSSTVACGKYIFTHPATSTTCSEQDVSDWLSTEYSDFVELLTYKDVPNQQGNMQGMGGDQPLFSTGDVYYEGQAIAMVVAKSSVSALVIAEAVQQHALSYVSALKPPVLNLLAGIVADEIFPDFPDSAAFLSHIWKVKRVGSNMSWAQATAPASKPLSHTTGIINNEPVTIVHTHQMVGAQLHFYMETQAAVVEPRDDGGYQVFASSQTPTAVLGAVATALNMPSNVIGVKIPQVGGAYGGKTVQSVFTAAQAACAAHKIGRPVHLALDRETDSAMIGRRHPYYSQAQLAVDSGSTTPSKKGMFMGIQLDIWGDGGAFFDCSFVVADCIQLRIDSGYYVPNSLSTIDVVRTNKAPNTAYRAFGSIQGLLMLENAIEDAAALMNMDAADVREKNLYQLGQSTPAGQTLSYCYMADVWRYTRNQSDYDQRLITVQKFNKNNRWRKRGICMMPVKYGSGFNLLMLEQTSALVNVSAHDGRILIRQGGVDMGQGLYVKLAQIAAYVLTVPLDYIRVEGSDTDVIPNPSSTGASTGTQYNGAAVKQCCEALLLRLTDFIKSQTAHDKNWPAKNFVDMQSGQNWGDKAPNHKTFWENLIDVAHTNRINLQSQVHAEIPGGSKKLTSQGPHSALEFKTLSDIKTNTGIPYGNKATNNEDVYEYVGFTYSAAVSEVEVDILTGEVTILRSDIVYDMGKSLNPAVDIGQVEGAFVQGVGYLLTEALVFEEKNTASAGTLNNPNTWGYKPPAVPSIPNVMNVSLFPRSEITSKIPAEVNTLFSSKEVGEPPMILANSVFFAVKSAIRASREERGLNVQFEMDAPATVQEVHRAIELSPSKMM